MTAAVAVAAPARDRGVDALRGLAVVLMVVDHALAVAGLHVLRLGPTRLSLPLFMVVSGLLLRPERPLRRLVAAGVVVTAAFAAMGLPTPDVLLVYALVVAACDGLLLRWPVQTAVAGLLWATEAPVGWPGYEPGLVLAYLSIGVLARAWYPFGLPRLRLLEAGGCLVALGRRPLAWYVGHVLALLLIVGLA